MNVWAITYEFQGDKRVLLRECGAWGADEVEASLHPAIRSKLPTIEFVGTLA